MSTTDVLLASAGEDVRLWQMPDLTLSGVRNGTNANVVACNCSANGKLVAYAHEEDGLTVASLVEDDAPLIKIPTGCEQSSVKFNGTSRFLLTGGMDNVINIWDIKTRVPKRTYKEHGNPVSCCIFNYNDSAMATASSKGEILMINVQTGLANDPMEAPDSQVIRDMGYSYFQRTLLASISDSGAVNLWDTKERKLVKTFNDHKSPGTGLSFSPLNDMLLCSTGLDKRIIFYDVSGKKTVKTINTEGPVTCCDFMHDGCTVAVGSASGRIYLFDLRQGSTPTKVIHAHKTSVRSLSFQRVPKEEKSPKKGIDDSKKSNEGQFATLPRTRRESSNSDGMDATGVNVGTPKEWESLSREASFNTLEDIAYKMPLKEHSGGSLLVNRENSSAALRYALTRNKPETPTGHYVTPEEDNSSSGSMLGNRENSSAALRHLVSRNKVETPTGPSKGHKILGDDVFSPVATDESTSKKIANRQKSAPKAHKIRPMSTTAEDEFDVRPSFPRSKSSVSKFNLSSKSTEDLRSRKIRDKLKEEDTTDGTKKSVLGFKSPFKKKTHIKQAFNYNKHSDESETSSIESFSLDDKRRGIKDRSSDRSNDSGNKVMEPGRLSPYGRQVDPQQLMNDIQHSLAVEANKSPSIHSGDFIHVYPNSEGGSNGFVNQTQFQVDFIQKMIDDAMEDNRTDMHNDMVNLQVEMIRQHEIQKEQIRGMLQQYSSNNDNLVSEVQRLRAENERLRTKY